VTPGAIACIARHSLSYFLHVTLNYASLAIQHIHELLFNINMIDPAILAGVWLILKTDVGERGKGNAPRIHRPCVGAER
jgi:hypothetical protein